MVQAAGGMLTHDAAFLRGVRALCDEFGALMVVDEVATGIGRTGRMWAVEHAGVTPDLLTCGKGADRRLPAAVGRARHARRSTRRSSAHRRRHARSSTGTPTPPTRCAAPRRIANLDLMAERGTVAHAAQVGERIGELLKALESYDGVREVRRIGTMTGIEVEPVDERTGFAVCQAARRAGSGCDPLGDVVVLMPPLAIGDDDLETLCGVVEESIREVVR